MKLKPCPFCGSTDITLQRLGSGIAWIAYCNNGCCLTKERSGKILIRDFWNKRAIDSRLLKAIEEIDLYGADWELDNEEDKAFTKALTLAVDILHKHIPELRGEE